MAKAVLIDKPKEKTVVANSMAAASRHTGVSSQSIAYAFRKAEEEDTNVCHREGWTFTLAEYVGKKSKE